jgi:hypothetical protein
MLRPGQWRLALAGFLLGYAVITEYPAALIAGAILIYALLLLKDIRSFVGILLGTCLPLLLLMGYSWAIWGTPFTTGYAYSALFPEHFSSGILGVTYPRLEALGGLTFSPYRGLFFLSAFLLLSIPGFYFLWSKPDRRKEFALILWGAASVLLFVSSIPQWDGGF